MKTFKTHFLQIILKNNVLYNKYVHQFYVQRQNFLSLIILKQAGNLSCG